MHLLTCRQNKLWYSIARFIWLSYINKNITILLFSRIPGYANEYLALNDLPSDLHKLEDINTRLIILPWNVQATTSSYNLVISLPW